MRKPQKHLRQALAWLRRDLEPQGLTVAVEPDLSGSTHYRLAVSRKDRVLFRVSMACSPTNPDICVNNVRRDVRKALAGHYR